MADQTLPVYQQYIVDELFPANEIHIIGGPSGSGKTTWLFQFMQDWTAGKPIHGYTSHPCDWYYVSCDRSLRGVFRTLDRMHVRNLDRSRMTSIVENHEGIGTASVKAFMLSIRKYLPNGGVLFIDGLALLAAIVPASKDGNYGAVGAFLMELARECLKFNITIIGTAHSPKMKENEKFLNPRQRVLGTVAWAGCSETIVIIEPKNDADIGDPSRMLLLLPRNSATIELTLTFNSEGRLVEETEAGSVVLDLWLNSLDPGHLFSTAEIKELCASKNVALRTVERWLKDSRESNRIESPKRGLYKKPYTT